MANRVNTSILQKYQGQTYNYYFLITAKLLDNDFLYFSNFNKKLEFENNVYTPTAGLLNIEDNEEDKKLDFKNKKITFAVPDHLLSNYFLKLEGQGIDKVVIIEIGIIDQDTNQLIGKYNYYRGKISDISINQDNPFESGMPKSILDITLSNVWIDSREKRGRITCDEGQKELFSNDNGFAFVQNIVDEKDIVWGSET